MVWLPIRKLLERMCAFAAEYWSNSLLRFSFTLDNSERRSTLETNPFGHERWTECGWAKLGHKGIGCLERVGLMRITPDTSNSKVRSRCSSDFPKPATSPETSLKTPELFLLKTSKACNMELRLSNKARMSSWYRV